MTVRVYFRKFLLMNWKNHKLQMANPLELVVILLMPPLFTLMAVLMRFFIPVDPRSDSVYDPIDLDRSWMQMVENLERARQVADEHNVKGNPFTPHLVIGWAPKRYSIFQAMMRRVQKQVEPMTMVGFDDCKMLRESMIENSLFAGICFDGSPFAENQNFEEDTLESDSNILPMLNYTILLPSELRLLDGDFRMANWMTVYNDDPHSYVLIRLNQPYEGGFVGYVREGFIRLQKAVSESFLLLTSHKSLPTIQIRRFPVTGRKQDAMMGNLDYNMPFIIIIGFLFPAQLLVWVVSEKQTQFRQYLINMNIGNLIHFVSWYLKGLIYEMISSLIIAALLKIRWDQDHGVLTQTPWYILLLVLFCYNCAAVAFAIMVSAFFRNALNAVRVLTILWIMSYVPTFILSNNVEGNIDALRYVLYVLPNVVATQVFEFLIERESIVHLTWEDSGYSLNYNTGPITVSSSVWILILSSVVYCAIGLYVDMWRGGDRTGKKLKKPNPDSSVHEDAYHERGDSFTHQNQAIGVNSTKIYEVEPSHRRFKLKIKKLCKRFAANDRPALNLFSWNVYENEVTVLMGHNGCGKSTLLKILAGLVEPSRGTVMVSTHNIQTERKAASMELGIAFGFDMLLTGFTVLDYLHFICRVKGLNNKIEIDGQSNYFLNVLQIGDLKTKRIRTLTDRDLSLVTICCAFVGNSPIVLIDDVHSDLDKTTQSLVWNLINEEKSKRTIILVSNSPALAENIADRMAIMSNGELKCTGTKPFLKNMYGHGYRLTCVKGKNYKMEDLFGMMNSYMPNMSIERDIGYKVTFVLENKYEDQFPMLIDDLEQNMQQLGVVSFRIRDTSMEEIFLRFGCEDNDQSGAFQSHENTQILLEEYYSTLAWANEKGRRTGWKLFFLHGRAVVFKRGIAACRHWVVLIFEMLAMALVTVCIFSSIFIYGKNFELAPLTFNLSQLSTVDAFVELFSDEEDVKDMHAYYTELLYWYDAHLATLTRTRHNAYTLLTQNEFSSEVNSRYIFGATFDQKIVTAWFNNIPLHAAPYALNIVHNAVARHLFDEEATIDVTLTPLPFRTIINTFPPSSHTFGGCLAFGISFVLTFIWPAFTIYLITERGSVLKKQQYLAGVRVCSYWTFTVIYDLLILLIFCACVVAMVAIYEDPSHDVMLYEMPEIRNVIIAEHGSYLPYGILIIPSTAYISITLMLGGFWVILLAYFTATLCRNPCYGFLWLCGINSLGLVCFSQFYKTNTENMLLEPTFLAMYTVGTVICKLFMIFEFKLICTDPIVKFTSVEVFKCNSTPNCCIKTDYNTPNAGVYQDLVILTILDIILLACFFVSEYHSILGFADCLMTSRTEQSPDSNQDSNDFPGVISQDIGAFPEKEQARDLDEVKRRKYAAVGIGIVTKYRENQVLRDLDFTVAKSECLSITGANNSGKTTLLKVVVNEMKMDTGELWIRDCKVNNHPLRCYRMVGYCPQKDSLPTEFTPKELLYIHALYQGHRHHIGRELSEALLRLMGLTPCWNRSVRMCTSGQIRRLYFAYAVLGSPELICVDGVPAGLDPTGKRIVLMMTSTMQEMGSSFLYTMLTGLDAERLSPRTPLLLGGQLWMIQPMENANENYRNGYQLEVRFKRKVNPNVSMSRATWNLINHFPMSPSKKFSAFMEIKFPDAVLKIEREDSMVFQMPLGTTTFSEIFLTLRKDAFEMNIEDYFITRNMLIGFQIFTYDQHQDNP